jgi:TusA-related sulfurtransferase
VNADAVWDAGDLGCGDLVLQLRFRMEALPPGQVLRLVALDSGAPANLPAWCRLTGHRLLSAEHPVFAPLRELMDNFAKAGGTIFVCSPCFKKRKLDESNLVAGAAIVGGAKLVEFLSDGSPCVSY